jgi:hypothetical protein
MDQGVYWLPPSRANSIAAAVMSPLSTMSLKNLHVVMGHLYFPDALQAAKAAGLRLTGTEQPFCETCALGKSTRASLPQAAEGKDVEPGQLIHTDFIGPFEESEVSGKRKFAILFLDHSTRWAKAYVLSHKSEALGAFKHFIEDMRALLPENPYQHCTWIHPSERQWV